ncbi:hypothetical protein BDZ91DRAFT_717481, partial [Kalaharituber pfeilii]
RKPNPPREQSSTNTQICPQKIKHDWCHLPNNCTFAGITIELVFFPSLLSLFTNHLAATIFPIHRFAFSIQSLTFP